MRRVHKISLVCLVAIGIAGVGVLWILSQSSSGLPDESGSEEPSPLSSASEQADIPVTRRTQSSPVDSQNSGARSVTPEPSTTFDASSEEPLEKETIAEASETHPSRGNEDHDEVTEKQRRAYEQLAMILPRLYQTSQEVYRLEKHPPLNPSPDADQAERDLWLERVQRYQKARLGALREYEGADDELERLFPEAVERKRLSSTASELTIDYRVLKKLAGGKLPYDPPGPVDDGPPDPYSY